MYSFINGKVVDIVSNYIVLENNGIGYLIYTSNPYSFNLLENYKIHIYQHVREDEISLYGFKEIEQKEMFLRLIDVKGLGCKMALPMFSGGDVASLISAIETEDINYLKKFPKIGDKLARQIILDLKGKLITKEVKINNDELIETLKALGYKLANINKILPNIDNNLSLENQVKEALKLLMK